MMFSIPTETEIIILATNDLSSANFEFGPVWTFQNFTFW